MLEIRPADLCDLEAITEIYNQAILHTTATFDIVPKTCAEQREWFEAHQDYFPILVGVIEGEIIGWTCLSKWSDRCGYASTAEISVYIHEKYRNKGCGRQLINTLIEMGRKSGLHTIIARLSNENQASLHLFEQLGFQYSGTIKEVGQKFGKLLDVIIMQLIFSSE